MGKGFLILLEAFLIVGIIHIFSMKAMKISESKKTQYRKFFGIKHNLHVEWWRNPAEKCI